MCQLSLHDPRERIITGDSVGSELRKVFEVVRSLVIIDRLDVLNAIHFDDEDRLPLLPLVVDVFDYGDECGSLFDGRNDRPPRVFSWPGDSVAVIQVNAHFINMGVRSVVLNSRNSVISPFVHIRSL